MCSLYLYYQHSYKALYNRLVQEPRLLVYSPEHNTTSDAQLFLVLGFGDLPERFATFPRGSCTLYTYEFADTDYTRMLKRGRHLYPFDLHAFTQSLAFGSSHDTQKLLRAWHMFFSTHHDSTQCTQIIGISRGGATILRALDALVHPDLHTDLLKHAGISESERIKLLHFIQHTPITLIHPLLDLRATACCFVRIPPCTYTDTFSSDYVSYTAISWLLRSTTHADMSERQPITILRELLADPSWHHRFTIALAEKDVLVSDCYTQEIHHYASKGLLHVLTGGVGHRSIMKPWRSALGIASE